MNPIETAPNDKAVLVFDKTDGFVVAIHRNNEWCACAAGDTIVDLYDGQESPFLLMKPSFWQSLPDEPGDR